MVAVGKVVMVTAVVAEKAEHPPAAATVYVTVYVPAVLVDGVTTPVEPSIVNPAVEEKVPPVVPVKVTLCPVETDLQNGELPYEIVAAGAEVIVTDVVAENAAHPPAAAMVYVTVYVPSVLVE